MGMFKFIPDFPDTVKGPSTGFRYSFNPPIIISPKGYWWRKLINTILRVIWPNTLFPLRIIPYPKLYSDNLISVQPMTVPSGNIIPQPMTAPLGNLPPYGVHTETGCGYGNS